MRTNRHKLDSIKLSGTIIDNLHSIQDVDNYNIYMIANTYLHNKSGLFSLNDIVNIYILHLRQESLKIVSNRNKFKKQLFKKLKNANIFFEHVEHETFKFHSYRKILNILGGSKHLDNYYHFPLENTISRKNNVLYKKTFLDLIISSFLLSHNGYSNGQVAKHFRLTVMRIQLATKRNNQKNYVKKIYRFVQTRCNDTDDAEQKRQKLWDIGIRSIIKEKGSKTFLCCFRSNTYHANLPSHKCRVRSNAEDSSIKKKYIKTTEKCIIFESQNKKKFKLAIPDRDFFYYNFKDTTYTLDNYIIDYGNIYNI
jgi:hypothetical protein